MGPTVRGVLKTEQGSTGAASLNGAAERKRGRGLRAGVWAAATVTGAGGWGGGGGGAGGARPAPQGSGCATTGATLKSPR